MRRRDFLKGSLVSGVGVVSLSATSVAETFSGRDSRGEASIAPVDLRCESLSEPLGIDAAVPRLSWKLKAVGNARNQVQSAYRIQVATTRMLLSSDTPDLWDSGRVMSDRLLHVEYLGQPLKSGTRAIGE